MDQILKDVENEEKGIDKFLLFTCFSSEASYEERDEG